MLTYLLSTPMRLRLLSRSNCAPNQKVFHHFFYLKRMNESLPTGPQVPQAYDPLEVQSKAVSTLLDSLMASLPYLLSLYFKWHDNPFLRFLLFNYLQKQQKYSPQLSAYEISYWHCPGLLSYTYTAMMVGCSKVLTLKSLTSLM